MNNNVFRERQHACNFYEQMDEWWHQCGSVMKHVMTSSNDSAPPRGDMEKLSNDGTYNMVTLESITPPSTPQVMGSKDKFKFHDQAFHIHLQRW
jgi:hypothetical protein